jgi:hypothetical protein
MLYLKLEIKELKEMFITGTTYWLIFGSLVAFIFLISVIISVLCKAKLSGIIKGFFISCLIALPIFVVIRVAMEYTTKKVVVIEDPQPSTRPYCKHTEYDFYGNPDIKLSNGQIVTTQKLNIKTGERYIINCSSSRMVLYAVQYASEGLLISPEEKNQYIPIYETSYQKVKAFPQYWFVDPPESVRHSEHFLIAIFHGLFGYSEDVWCIVDTEVENKVN